jgi:hypothetical protein
MGGVSHKTLKDFADHMRASVGAFRRRTGVASGDQFVEYLIEAAASFFRRVEETASMNNNNAQQ